MVKALLGREAFSPSPTLFFPFLPLDLCIYNNDDGGGGGGGGDGFTFTEFLLCVQKCDKSFTFNNMNYHVIFTRALQN